ncbi:MAG: hypothetical protein JRH20_31765 [Deltaproteobacteria bacterium]|nr:hypothetical protein [Deltaproteobacteria bacterium]
MMRFVLILALMTPQVFFFGGNAEARRVHHPSPARLLLAKSSQVLSRVGWQLHAVFRAKRVIRTVGVFTMAAVLSACMTIQVPLQGATVTKPGQGVEVVIPAEKLPAGIQETLHEIQNNPPQAADYGR